jgi:hypothetical protein
MERKMNLKLGMNKKRSIWRDHLENLMRRARRQFICGHVVAQKNAKMLWRR